MSNDQPLGRTTAQLFIDLLESKEEKVKTGSRVEHENLRKNLGKRWAKHLKLMSSIGVEASDDPDLGLSLSATYVGGISTFTIRERRQPPERIYELG